MVDSDSYSLLAGVIELWRGTVKRGRVIASRDLRV